MEKDQVNFLCKTAVGDPCHLFDRVEINRETRNVYIRLYSKRKKEDICITVIDTLKIPLSVSVPGGQAYRFYFWQLENSYLDTLIFIP
jgi:hypothetical protein